MSWSLPAAPSPEQEADYPALGFVPCPGDEPTATGIAQDVRQTATTLGDIVFLLSGTAGPGQWRGRSAEAFRESFDEDFRPKVEAARDSFAIAASALEDWSRYMPSAQNRARNLETEAREAQTALDALPSPTPVNPFEEMPEEEREQAINRFRQQEADQQTAQQRLEDIRSRALALAMDYTEYGESIAERLNNAGDIAPNKPGWLSRIGDAIGDVINAVTDLAQEVLENFAQWFRENAAKIAVIGDILLTIADVYSTVGNVLRSVARFIPIPQVRGVVLAVARGFKISGWTMQLAGLGAYGVADWGGADVQYPWEDIDWPWLDMPWEGEIETLEVDMDQFIVQGAPLETSAADAEAIPFVPGASARQVLSERVADRNHVEALGLATLPTPSPVAIPEVPLYLGFDRAWHGQEAA
ncbi:hypothetical protein [Streptomyces sp. NBRC 109706]|uniref:putative T7SS-secreted protein n=1 Tax=Streptomyces sp. NBRC 109706 TaxID=1550035 RepID=UPI00078621D8|nr:hypothetical protein [Streptomyces sp. NBRC 109706]